MRFYDEMTPEGGGVRPHYAQYAQWLAQAQVQEAARAEKKAARARKGRP